MVALGLLALAGLLAPAASHLVGERHTAFRRAPAGPPNFSYQGETGPLGWEAIDPAKYGTCAHGKEQSPINFHAGYQKNVLNNGSNRPKLNYPSISSAEIVNLGNTIETEAAGGELTLPSDGSVWKVVQFHFHTPSEHRLSDEWFPLEIHFVHKKKDDESKLLVLGITFEVSDCDSTTPLVQGVLEKALTIPNFGDKTQSGELDFSQVVEHVKKVDTFRYAGSLTTPPCSEGVTWLVSSEPLPIDVKSYLAAKRVMKYNSRYTQNDPGQINLLEYAAESLSNKV